MASPAASSTALFTRLPVDSLSNDVSKAALLFKNDRCAVIEAMLVLIESGMCVLLKALPFFDQRQLFKNL